MPDLLSARGLTRTRIESLLQTAGEILGGEPCQHPDAIVGFAFFEDSLRTRIGFETATARLGARTTTVLAPRRSPAMEASETLEDTIRCIGGWCDAICLRHPDRDAPTRAASVSAAPIVNCGNGDDEHPTQALIDVLALHRLRGRVDGTSIAIVGDLAGMRCVHSLALALACFDDIAVRCISPTGLGLPATYADAMTAAGHALETSAVLDIEDVDIVYMAGLPPQTKVGALGAHERANYRMTAEVASRLSEDALILCPLPRVDEIDRNVDELPQAAYFQQSDLGLAMRMAILDEVLAQVGSPEAPLPTAAGP